MVGRVERQRLHERVLEMLGRQIVSGTMKVGEALPTEQVLATELGVSRTALREAVKVLEAKGLLVTRPRTGTRVRSNEYWHQLDGDVLAWRCATIPTERFVTMLVQMRMIVEPAGAALAAEHRTSLSLEKIVSAYEMMESASEPDAWAVADTCFHRAILVATDNEFLVSLFNVIDASMSMFFRLSSRTVRDFKKSLPRHRDVLDAIRKRRATDAEEAMRGIIVESQYNMKRPLSAATQGGSRRLRTSV